MTAQTKQINGKGEALHHVLRADVPRLAKSLETHGPEALCVLTVVVTMLDWWEKNDAFRCTILAPEGGEDQGVCALIMEEYDVKRLLLYAPEGETTRFLKCLEETTLISWDSVSTVGRVLKRLIDPLEEKLKAKGYKLYDGSWNHLMTMSPEDALALQEPKLPNNVSLRALTEGDASFIAKNWKYAEIDGVSLTRDGIKYNGGVGAVDKDGNLVGWITWNLWGILGHLYVSPSHRRLGLAAMLTIRMSKEIAKKGRIVTAEVVDDNDASLSLFKSLGFHCDHINRSLAMGRDKLPKNVSIRALTEVDASFIAKNWKHALVDTAPLIRDGIKFKCGVGAVDKDGKLVGWVTLSLWGIISHLLVLPSHRRHGLAAILTIRMSKEIAKKGRIVVAEVVCDSNASLSLLKSLGFHCDHINRYQDIGCAKQIKSKNF